MSREIDEAWIEEAVERYGRLEDLRARFEANLRGVEVTVNSADGSVEVVVSAEGTIRDVVIAGPLDGRDSRELSRSVREAVVAAGEAAAWARRKLHAETFGGYPTLLGDRPATHERARRPEWG
jgi:DNA-binding protein YbaB